MAYPPTSRTVKAAISEAVFGVEAAPENVLHSEFANANMADVLANAKLDLQLADARMEKLQGKIAESESQIADWTKQVESLRVAIQRAYVAQVGYEELLPVAVNKQKIAAQRVERLERSLKKFERQVKLEDYLKELEREEDGKEEYQRYWKEVGEVASIPRPSSADASDGGFDDLGEILRPASVGPDREPVVATHSSQIDDLDLIINGLHTPAPSSPRTLNDVPVLSPSPRRPISLHSGGHSPPGTQTWSPRIEVTEELHDQVTRCFAPSPASASSSRPTSSLDIGQYIRRGSPSPAMTPDLVDRMDSADNVPQVDVDKLPQLVDYEQLPPVPGFLDEGVGASPPVSREPSPMRAPETKAPSKGGKKGGAGKKGKK